MACKALGRAAWHGGRKKDRDSAGSGHFFPVGRTAAVCNSHSSGNGCIGFQCAGGKAERIWKKRRADAGNGQADTGRGKAKREKGNN